MNLLSFLKLSLFVFSLSFILLTSSCAPIFSEMQSAHTVGKNNIDATASFSSVSAGETDFTEGGHIQNHVGVQASYGLLDKVDLRIRYAYLWLDDDGGTANILGAGPKVSIIEDRLAAYVPVGFGFGEIINENSNTWQVHPTVIGTIPILDILEINPSAKALIPFEKDRDMAIAFNLGIGVKLPAGFTIRPEFGLLFDPGDEGHNRHLSIGVTYNPSDKGNSRSNKKRKKRKRR